MKLIDKDALVAEITHKIKVLEVFVKNFNGISDKVEKAKNKIEALGDILLFVDTLEVKEIEENKLPNPRFPHLNNIIDKVFGTGNLESFEYEEAEQLVLLAKEELLKDLEAKEVDLDFLIHEEYAAAAKTECDCIECATFTKIDFTQLAKRFFELGLKVAQKGGEV